MLQLIDISKQYRTGELVQQALDRVNFSLRDNEFVSVLGPSGSGKTTLLNIIGGLDRYDSGDLIIDGVSTKEYRNRNWDAYRNHTIGFVFQSYNLIQHQSILSNVELALTIGGMSIRERRKKAKNALEAVGLGDQLHKKPNQLSGGQMQRVAIARALVNDPEILLADEPTGALDSDTSIQIMELLKNVAKDRLVVMVTHNAELAREYSTRIITLKDGRVTSDSNPFIPAGDPLKENRNSSVSSGPGTSRKEKAGMSFLTSLALSANNLKSKKGRTVLISLASSIGIIGIALILSISTGVNDYIINIQKETMSSYPITISAQTIDLNGLINEGNSVRDELMNMMLSEFADDGRVHADYSNMEASEVFTTSMVENNLTDFKKYLDDPESEINEYLGENGIVYTYDVAFDVYTKDPDGILLNTDSSVNDIVDSQNTFAIMSSGMNFMRSNMFTWQNGNYSSASNFSEIAPGRNGEAVSQVVKDNYDLLYGQWPDSFDQVVLVLNRASSVQAETLYQLGILKGSEYKELSSAIEKGEETPEISFSYDDIVGKKMYLVTASDHYIRNEDGTYSYLEDSYMNQDRLMENAVELEITGIIRPSQDASSPSIFTAIGYTSGLTDYCIDHTSKSQVITAQQENPDINVFTGLKFSAETDEQKITDTIDYIRNLPSTEKARLYTMIAYYESGEERAQEMPDEKKEIDDFLNMFGLSDNSSVNAMMQMLGDYNLNELFDSFSMYISNESQQAALLDQWLENDPDPQVLVSIYDMYLVGGSYEENMSSFGMVSYDAPVSINIYTDTFEDKDNLTACIDRYNEQADQDSVIVYTDYIALLTSSITQIVNAVSYVLIAFVAVSLIVSCIMIGIITHISVLERTKEIGILRAMGASRSNISHVFNAETVIIGFISGLIGILITVLLTMPINMILSFLLGSEMINVHLPVLYALMLIAISVTVTVIGGIIPAARASRKDPVIALRTE